MPKDAPPHRRDFLTYGTIGTAAVGLGAVVNGLGAATFAPRLEPETISIDLNGVAEGTAITVKFKGKPWVIRHRTAKEIAEIDDTDLGNLPDPLAQNANLEKQAPATDLNRRATADGRFTVMSQNCTHLGCVVLIGQGDFNGYFCPCHGGHFDTSGRVRKGPPPNNLPIPAFEITESGVLTIFPSSYIASKRFSDLIYR